jgi:hypothetical protein
MDVLYVRLVQALGLSILELVHCLTGLTRSKPAMVLMFLCVRGGVEYFVGPAAAADSSSAAGADCLHWSHLYTIACWSIGECIRFGCFAVAEMFPDTAYSHGAKHVRYTAGPIMFPLGALGEMAMVTKVAMAKNNNPWIWFAVSLWPAGFYPLMKQLLRQRKKFMSAAAFANENIISKGKKST